MDGSTAHGEHPLSYSRLDAVLKESGVTALQYTALSVLERRPTMSAADLARASFVRAQNGGLELVA